MLLYCLLLVAIVDTGVWSKGSDLGTWWDRESVEAARDVTDSYNSQFRNFVSANWTLIFANAECECEEVILGIGAHIWHWRVVLGV